MKPTIFVTSILAVALTLSLSVVEAKPSKAAKKFNETSTGGGITIPKGMAGMVDFSEAPVRENDKYPLSDQKNKGKWKLNTEDSDEFNTDAVNIERWYPNNPTWKGRQPTFFHASNVSMRDGYAVFKVNQHGDEPLPEGYTHTAGFLVGRKSYLYGYFEARLKPNDTPWVTGFWLQCGAVQPDYSSATDWVGTEIDICENAPGIEKNRYSLNSNVHAHQRPNEHNGLTERQATSFSRTYQVPFALQEDFHTWGLEWTEEYLRFYLDGVMFREVPNLYWHYPQEVKINNESNKWFGALPDDDRLEGEYLVDYFRVWQRKGMKRY